MSVKFSTDNDISNPLSFLTSSKHRRSLPSNPSCCFISRISSGSSPILSVRGCLDVHEKTSLSSFPKHFHNISAPAECSLNFNRSTPITSNASSLSIHSTISPTCNSLISDSTITRFSQYPPQLSTTSPPSVIPRFQPLTSSLPFAPIGSAQSIAQVPSQHPTNPFISSVPPPIASQFTAQPLTTTPVDYMSHGATQAHLRPHRSPLSPLLIPSPQASASLPRPSQSSASASSASPFQNTNPFLPLAAGSSPLHLSNPPHLPLPAQPRQPRTYNDSVSASASASELGGAASATEDADSESEFDSQHSATATGTELEELPELEFCRAAQSTRPQSMWFALPLLRTRRFVTTCCLSECSTEYYRYL